MIAKLPLALLVLGVWFYTALPAQQPANTGNTPAIITLFEYLKIEKAEVQRVAPHFPFNYTGSTPYQQLLEGWLKQYPAEWKALNKVPAIAQQGIGWATYGIPEKYIQQPVLVNSSWYQWYQAANVTAEVKKQRFPHFPELDNTLKGDTQGLNFDHKVGIWQRLYPKEYNAFLNTPQLKALNPYAPETIRIEYMPRFLGAVIETSFPVIKKTGNALQDEFDYQLRVRNWYFVFKPSEFEKRYGNDYDFPNDFNAEDYRSKQKMLIERKKSADYNTNIRGK